MSDGLCGHQFYSQTHTATWTAVIRNEEEKVILSAWHMVARSPNAEEAETIACLECVEKALVYTNQADADWEQLPDGG